KNSDNAVIEVFDDVIECAKKIDEKRNSGKVGKLAGTFFMIEDSIMVTGKKMSHGSKILEDFVSPFTSPAVQKLLDEDAIVLGRCNVNEFSYYAKNNTSNYGKVKNAFGIDLTVNSGVGVAVSKGLCDFAIGNDVCANVRKSGALNGVSSYRPTYGLVSRVGVSSLASSFDSLSFAILNEEDSKTLIDMVSGEDIKDMNSIGEVEDKKSFKKKIAYIGNIKSTDKAVEGFKKAGYEVKEVCLPDLKALISAYQIMLSAECGSNLSRIDGIKFGKRSENCSDIEEVYRKTRTEFLGKPIKYLTMLGNYMIFTKNVCEYYSKSLDIRNQIRLGVDEILDGVDAIVLPLNVNTKDIVDGVKDYYKLDENEVYNVLPEMLGLPTLSVSTMDGEASSVMLLSSKFNDENLINVAIDLKKSL
ncbi:MAG: hypothetical protein KBS91_00285, partial [Firmicutes bacterium]|nr:hypothetical protein [Candidatus Caballimonas caccae]